jgi:hypothetical protein
MRPRLFVLLGVAALLCAPSVMRAEPSLPEGSKPLTEILRPIEARTDFAYLTKSNLNRGVTKLNITRRTSRRLRLIR